MSNLLSEYDPISLIATTVEDYYDLPSGSIQIKARKREIVQARQIAMFFSKKLTKSSLSTIGAALGRKDHTSVLYSCKTVNNLIDTDKQFKIDVDKIEIKIAENIKKQGNVVTLKRIFMLGYGVIIGRQYSEHTGTTYHFDVCCAVAKIQGFKISEIAKYTYCEKEFIETRINYAFPPKIQKMNELINKIYKS